MKRIGIFGGTFNPIHNGHLLVAESVLETCGLERMLMVPCSVSPFKRIASDLAEGPARLEMIRLCTEGDGRFEPCDVDVVRGGVSYAIDTVRFLQARHPDVRFCFLIGMDALRELHLWHKAEEFVTSCDIITVERPGFDAVPAVHELGFPEPIARHLLQHRVHGRRCEISSSEIRRRIAEGKPIRYLVHPAVEAYIRQNGLYGKR